MPPETGEPRRVAVLGLGLMGASLGMALRALRWTVAGYDMAQGVVERAVALGAADVACASVTEAVSGASVVVLAAPVLAIRDLLAELAPALARDAAVTDLGSTKSLVTRWAAELLPHPERFVGGHPMTGSEQSGVEAACPDLYYGCLWCLTPTRTTAPDAAERIAAMVQMLGGRPYVLAPERHDEAVALVSHLPLVAASALVLAANSSSAWGDAAQLAAGGWRDTSRVASGSPRMARDICLTNRAPLLGMLDAYLSALQDLRAQIAAGDESVEDHFASAKSKQDAWLRERG